jgi:hypothetical protein
MQSQNFKAHTLLLLVLEKIVFRGPNWPKILGALWAPNPKILGAHNIKLNERQYIS